MAKATHTDANDVVRVHRITALAVDMSGEVPDLTVTFSTRIDDTGPVVSKTLMPLGGDEFVNVFGVPATPELSRVEDLTAALFGYAISHGELLGTFDPE